MDRIEPIRPSPPASSPAKLSPVQRVSRDRDRPDRRRGQEDEEEPPSGEEHATYGPYPRPAPDAQQRDEGDDGRPHIDVRV